MIGCGAPTQSAALPVSVDSTTATVIAGAVSKDGTPVGGAYVRLLDAQDEFTAEVITSPSGQFRFFAAPGRWTLSVMHRDGTARRETQAPGAGIHEVQVALG